MDIEQGGKTYLQIFPSTKSLNVCNTTTTQQSTCKQDSTYLQTFSSTEPLTTYNSTQESACEQDNDDFLSVGSLYATFCKSMVSKDVLHYVGMGLKLYGSGGFSNAVSVSQTGVAKLPRIAPGSGEFSEKDFYRDLITELRIAIHTPIRTHENIITLQDVQWRAGPNLSGSARYEFMWPILEFETASCNLIQLLRNVPALSFTHKINLCYDLAKALDCLHDCGIVHSDIKCENAFIFPHPHRRYIAKIADFGCSLILDGVAERTRLSGFTKLWCAPEYGDEMSYEELCRTDIYSFGLMVWQVITKGDTPFQWFSWTDDVTLSHDNITALKEDNCMLPLALEALENLGLEAFERRICMRIFNGTLDPNRTRVDYLSPLLGNSWVVEKWGDRDIESIRIGRKEFLGPIPTLDITNLLQGATLDHRLPVQIFESIKNAILLALDTENEATLTNTLFQLFLCYHHGYGTDRNPSEAMSILAKAAGHGHIEAQAMVAQFHLAYGVEVPLNLPIHDWLEEQALSHTMGAARTLQDLDTERYHQVLSKQRNTIETDMGLCSFNLSGIEDLIANRAWESRTLIKEIGSRVEHATGLSLVHIAAAFGNLPMVQGLLDHGLCDSNMKTSPVVTPLYLACRGGHLEVTLLLLSREPTPNTTLTPVAEEEIGDTCLHWLSSFDPSDMMEVATNLISKGAALNGLPGAVDTPLMRAVIYNNIEVAKVLLGLGAQVTSLTMEIVASLRYSDMLHLLLYDLAEKRGRLGQSDLGRLINAATVSSTLSAIQFHGFSHSCAVISTFETLNYFINLWYPSPSLVIEHAKCKALRDASAKRMLDVLQLAFDPFFKNCISLCSKGGLSVLTLPMILGDTDIFSLFIENGAAKYGKYHTDENGIRYHSMDQVFCGALKSSNPFFIGKLLQQGLWLDEYKLYEATGGLIQHYSGGWFCPFQLAVLETCYDTATFLAKTTMQIETNTYSWNTFLCAVISTQEQHGFTMLDYLLNLSEGPPPLPHEDGATVLHDLAGFWSVDPEPRRGNLRKYWPGIISRFQDQIDTPNNNDETPLECAAAYHNVLMVEALIDAGVNLNAVNKKGETVLDTILFNRVIQILRINPRDAPPTPSEIAITREMEVVKIPSSEIDMAQTDAARSVSGINGFNRKYQGDLFDKRLDTIYAMIRESGGISGVFKEDFSCTEKLETWSKIWVGINRSGFSYVEGETREIINRMVSRLGTLWRIPSPDGCHTYVNVGMASRSGAF